MKEMKERLILEICDKKYEAVREKTTNLCKNCCFVEDEQCPEILQTIDCGYAVWREIKEQD